VYRTGKYKDRLKVESMLIFIVIFIIAVKFLKEDYYKLVVLVIFIGVLVNAYIRVRYTSLDDLNEETMKHLDELQAKMYDYVDIEIVTNKLELSDSKVIKMKDSTKLESMYLDSRLINFLFSVINLYDYNPKQFFSLLKGTNNILKGRQDIEKFYKSNREYPYNTSDIFRVSLKLKTSCMNNVHNFIYTIPKNTQFYEYHYNIMTEYDKLITKHIDAMYYYTIENIKLRGINSETTFPKYHPKYKIPNDYRTEDKLQYFI